MRGGKVGEMVSAEEFGEFGEERRGGAFWGGEVDGRRELGE